MTGRKGTAALGTALTVLVVAAGAGRAPAATTEWQPQPDGARTFASGAGGWSAGVVQEGGGLTCSGILHVRGVTCPAVANGWEAGGDDGHLRTSVQTLVGLLSTTAITWTSPSFTLAARPDVAAFGFELRGSGGSLLDAGRTTVAATLADLTDPARSVPLVGETAVAGSGGWNAYGGAVSPAQLHPGHSYAVRIVARVGTPVGLAVGGSIDLDDVALGLVDLDPPTGLTATLAADTVGIRVSGSVDPHGQPTTVAVDYGTTTAYGQTTTAVVSGSGAQAWSLPLAGLRPATRHHFRVRATNADGAAATADGSFTSPAQAASDGPPMLVGASGSRQRIAVFDLDVAVTAAVVEVREAGDGRLLASFPDGDLDGTATIALPEQSGSYDVRVVRTRSGVGTPSPAVTALYDATPPDVSGALVIVVPWSSAERTRGVTVLAMPGDAVSAELQVLDAAEQPIGAPSPVAADGTGTISLPAAPGSYRVRASFVNGAGLTATARSLPIVLAATAEEPEPGGAGPGGPGSGGPGAGDPGTGSGSGSGDSAGSGAGAQAAGGPPARLPLTVPVATDARRRLVGRIAPRRLTVGGVRVTVSARAPRTITETAALRFAIAQRGRTRLKAVRWTLGGRTLRSAALRAAQLRADGGAQTVAVRLVPERGSAATVSIRFRTRAG